MMRPNSARGQSSVVGVVLLLGITILGTGAVVGLGAQAFADTERTATVSQVEHSLTQFDSQAAVVALGGSHSQRVDLGSPNEGEFVSESDSGWMRVVHHNATGARANETIYNASMGAVSYRNGDVEVGYQGGGVWERRGNGSVMRSPPEFNYRGATLTLPAIRVNSDDKASGQTTAVVTQADRSERVYPSNTTYNNSTKSYANPVTSGNVTVTVQSRFYQGWAEFFRTRTTGNVSVDRERGRASVELMTVDTVGKFDLGEVIGEEGLSARGQAPGHSLTDFNVSVETEGKAFNNFDTQFYAESSNHRFALDVYVPGGARGNKDVELEATILYENTETGERHEWANNTIPADSGPIRLEDDRTKLVVNLTAGNRSSGQELTLESVNPGNDDGDEVHSGNVTFSHDGEDDEPTEFSIGDEGNNEATTYLLARHYVSMLGDEFTLQARAEKPRGADIDYDDSGGVLNYESGSGGTYITYLHVTENSIEVELG